MTASAILKRLRQLGDAKIAAGSQRFFKTDKGEYGEGDTFIGIRVPTLRSLAKEHQELSLSETVRLLQSSIHEARLLALLILVLQYRKADPKEQTTIYRQYLANTPFINGWDLVDSSAEHIVGAHLFERSRAPLHKLVKSKSIWERRIAIMSTFHFIRNGDFAETLSLAEKLLQDDHDLIHKAVGWMLREIGNRDLRVEERFLKQHYQHMPRTMLRYAIEKFPERKRKAYLQGKA